MDDTFYIYRHIRLDKNTPFYIGKGLEKRAYSKQNRNPRWHNIVNKHSYRVEIIMNNLTEKQAFKKEIEFIKLYKSLSYCEANLTDGGEGASGMKHSVESRMKIGKSSKGEKNGFYGRKHSKETLEKLSESQKDRKHSKETRKKMSLKTSKPIVCFNGNGYYKEFKSLKSCALKLNLLRNGISAVLNKHQKTHCGFKFKYLKDLQESNRSI